MRKVISFVLVAVLIPLFVTSGCRKYEDPSADEFQILVDYVKANGKDLSNVLDGWVKPASGIGVVTTDYSVPNYYVMDLRSATDFDLGHIKGAHQVALANVLTEAENAGATPILMVCYTGQTAARATGLLRLSGKTAYCLKWGMAGWHSAFQAKWTSNAAQLGSPSWVTTGAAATPTVFDLPTLNTGKTTGAEILQARIQAALANTSWSVSKTDVLANPSNYFINNKWGEAHFNTFGHISGTYRIDVGDGLGADGLMYMNPDATAIVSYCYTGQTSSILNSWLNVMGYDNGKSLLFGATGIIWDDLRTGPNSDATSKKSTWQGDSSAWNNNFGYYKTDGTYVSPI